MPDLTWNELRDALDGLFAYDDGATDSGIHDEELRRRCMNELDHRLNAPDGRLFMSRLMRDMWLSEEALQAGYGYEDLLSFCRWLADRMHVDLGI